MTLLALKAQLRRGAFAWPGGYPLFFETSEGEALCFPCVRRNWRDVCEAHMFRAARRNGWYITCAAVNWEDSDLFCDCCSKRIESAYGEDTDEIQT